jgi:hypothetical protein
MKSFFDYKLPKDKPWLILGKGPTFDKAFELDLKPYYLMGLNHVASLLKVDITHCIDIECLSGNVIANSNKIVIPIVPHFKNRPIEDVTKVYANLSDKFLFYNCSTYKKPHFPEMGPIVKVRYFSVEAAFRLLAMQGIKKIHTLGIDGGTKYSKYFADLKPLTNGRKTFNDQFDEIAKITKKWKLAWHPLGDDEED